MGLTTTKTVLTVVLILWLFTLFRSITIMIGGKKIFSKAAKGEKAHLYPIINLFSMLEIADVSTYFGILLFIPVINMLVLIVMSYKLGTVFRTGFIYKIGLILLPILFYPLLGASKRIYKLKDNNYFKALDNAKAENLNLMQEDEIEENNDSEPYDEEKIEVDSIFKSNVELMEKAAPYKAVKIDLYGMDKLKNADDDKDDKPKHKDKNDDDDDFETLDL